ncbi:MAG: hypothetical protein EZS28_054359, partial [Streblomastix strix]
RDLENRKTDKENREILGRNGGQTARYLEQWETINMKDFNQQGFTLQWKDNLSINNLQRQLKTMKFRGTEDEAKEYKIIEREMEKDTRCESAEQTDGRLPLQDALSIEVKQTIRLRDWGTSLDLTSAFHHLIVQAESQPYLAFEFQNNHYTYRAMPFGTKHSPIYFATAMEPIMQQIRMKTEIRIINYVDDILLLHQNKEYLKN